MKRKNWNENLYTASWRKSTWPNYSERVTYPDHEPTTKPAPQPRKTKSIQQILQETAKQWNKENPHSQIQVNRKLKPRPRKEPELSRQIFWKEQDIKFHKQTYERTHKNLTLEEQMKKQQIILLLERELKQLQTRYNTQQKDNQ
jgi:hypothetical protein